MDLKRVMVIGPSGAGKTVLAKRLSSILGTPYFNVDSLVRSRGGDETPRDRYRSTISEIAELPAWVFDGSRNETIISRATMVIWLRYSFRVCLARFLQRRKENLSKRGGKRTPFIVGFSWVVRTQLRGKRRMLAMIEDGTFGRVDFVELTDPEMANDLIRSIESDATR